MSTDQDYIDDKKNEKMDLVIQIVLLIILNGL